VLYISVGVPRPAISQYLSSGILIRTDVGTGEFVGVTVFDFSIANEHEYEDTLRHSSKTPVTLLGEVIDELRRAQQNENR
jgi:hypothetical protein